MALRPRGILSFAVRAARNAEARAAERAAAEAADQAAAKAGRTSLTVPRKKVQRRPAPTPPKVLALPPPGPGLPDFAVKPRGGQWWPDREVELGGYTGNFSPEASAREIFRARFPDLNPELEPETAALRTWFERALPRYIKNELGTPEDPLRRLAEQGLLHLPDLSPEGWSRSAAGALIDEPIGNILFPRNPKGGMPGAGNDYRGGVLASMPWLAKAPVTDKLYSVTPQSLSQLGFSHVIDEMQQALYPEHFGLPLDLAVRPESLDRMSLAAAVERAGRIGQWRNKQMEQAALSAMDNPAIQLFKEYPENNPMGLRWVELKTPDTSGGLPEGWTVSPEKDGFLDPKGEFFYTYPGQGEYDSALQQALRYEGDTMGHCVGGYCEDVLEGRSRIFSLRDAKGEPHVTIETSPAKPKALLPSGAELNEDFLLSAGLSPIVTRNVLYAINRNKPIIPYLTEARKQFGYGSNPYNEFSEAIPFFKDLDYTITPGPDDIIQIKGKQNRAPKDDYLPFVQDFVKSQQWGNVGDLGNTGLVRLPDGRYITAQQAEEAIAAIPETTTMQRAYGSNEMVPTRKVYDPTALHYLDPEEWTGIAPHFEGYAIGGRVSPDRCFCRHPMSVR